MIDLHLHCGTTPGDLLPAEVAVHAARAGYRGVALLLRADAADLPSVLPAHIAACRRAALFTRCELLAGVELVVPIASLLDDAVREARACGAQLVAAHGELPGGTAPEGTNLAAIEASVDLLLHPGSLRAEEAALAAARGVALELSCYPDHGLYNGHIAILAIRHNATLVSGSNTRQTLDLPHVTRRYAILQGAGLDAASVDRLDAACLSLFARSVR